MKELSPKDIVVVIEEAKMALDKGAHPLAAFDADGTLWNTDLGENFFKFQARHQLVELPPDPWDFYDEWHQREPIPAYLWLAQVNKGKPIETVRQWAKDALSEYTKVPIFPHMVDLIQALKEMGTTVRIVTASVKWAVEPAAELVGLKPEDVLGITTTVDAQGLVTDQQLGPITWQQGKVEGILADSAGKAPFLAAGNSTGDTHLLKAATHVALAHSATRPGHAVYNSEQELLREAERQNWYRLLTYR